MTADLKVDKDTQLPLPPNGQEYDYTFTVSSTGPGTAVNIVMLDVLSPFTTFVSASAPATCSDIGSGVVRCTMPDLPPGGDQSFVIRVLLSAGAGQMTQIFNTCVVSSDNADPNLVNNVDSVTRFTLGGPPLAAAAAKRGDEATGASAAAKDLSVGMTVSLTAQQEASLHWTDRTPVEDAFVVESRLGQGPWVPVAIVPSTTKAGMGATYEWLSKPLPPGLPYDFRVNARDSRPGPWIPLAQTDEPLMAPSLATAATGCIDGQLLLEGRSRHGGAVLSVDGLPVGLSERRGSFHLCGMRPGVRSVGAWQSGYLPAEQSVTVGAGAIAELPDLTLVGGDVNRDRRIDVVDLVLAGAAAGWDSRTFTPDLDGDGVVEPEDARKLAAQLAANPDRLLADVNGDGAINRTDIILVGANLDKAGPTAWNGTAATTAPAMLELMARGAANDLRWLRGPLGLTKPDDRYSILSTAQDDGTIKIDIVATGVHDLYGADIVLGFDAAKVRVLDAQPVVPGAQAELGEVWGADSFQAVNDASRARSQWRLVTTRIDPAAPIAGNSVVLASLRVMPVHPEAGPAGLEGAWQLTSARLLDRRARDLGARVSGSTIRVPGLDGRTVWLPFVTNKERIANR